MGSDVILIAPFAQKLRFGDNKINAKNYPVELWRKIIEGIKDEVIQVGATGEEKLVENCKFDLTLPELADLVQQCDTWIGVDSFFQHFAWDLGKRGIVLWGQSDPEIFGHPENINMLHGRHFLREKQFYWWELCPYRNDCWVTPKDVLRALKTILPK